MIKVRRGVFETNSSSMHTLVLLDEKTMASNDDIKATFIKPLIKYKGKYYLKIDGGNFGQEFEILNTLSEKFSYLMAGCRCLQDVYKLVDVVKELITEVDPKTGNDFEGFIFDDEREWYSDDNDKEMVPNSKTRIAALNTWELFFNTGEIDHQSTDVPANAIHLVNKDSKKAIKEILMNNKFIFVTDSDGSEDFVKAALKDGIYDAACIKGAIHTFYPTKKTKDEKTGKERWTHVYEDTFPYWKTVEEYKEELATGEDDD